MTGQVDSFKDLRNYIIECGDKESHYFKEKYYYAFNTEQEEAFSKFLTEISEKLEAFSQSSNLPIEKMDCSKHYIFINVLDKFTDHKFQFNH